MFWSETLAACGSALGDWRATSFWTWPKPRSQLFNHWILSVWPCKTITSCLLVKSYFSCNHRTHRTNVSLHLSVCSMQSCCVCFIVSALWLWMDIMQYMRLLQCGFGILCRTPNTSTAKMMQCFHFLVEPAKALTAKIKVPGSKAALLLNWDQPFFFFF